MQFVMIFKKEDDFMKINWKVRLKNHTFWLTVVPATVTFVYCLLSAFDIVPGISEVTVINALTAIITGLTALGVLVDPTTKGLDDSERAMRYEVPVDDREAPPQEED